MISLFNFKKSFLPLTALLLFALCYYSYYYRCSLYPASEGGVEGVTALRLLSGKIPITEVALNYNLLWFYPIVALFKFFGPNYTLLRIYFFTLAALSGLIAFSIVKTTTQQRWLALIAGILAIVLPGQLFRNYMAFIVLLNMATFLKAFVLPCSRLSLRLFWMLLASLSLAVSFLLRLDLGYFLSTIYLGLSLFYPWLRKAEEKAASLQKGALLSCTALLLAGSSFVLLHVPFYLDATERGFVAPFVNQYCAWPHMITTEGKKLLAHALSKVTPAPTTKLTPPSRPLSPQVVQTQEKKSALIRRSFSSSDIREQLMAFNLYLPLITAFFVVLLSCTLMLRSPKKIVEGTVLLTCLACSFTLFPQYFFWRPDMVHLSEFMVPMTATLLITSFFAGKNFQTKSLFLKILAFLVLLISLLTISLYYISGCQSQSTGGIAISEHRTLEFVGANGVRVKLAPHEFEETNAIYQSILKNSKAGDYVICFPYNPEINFMTDRPSYRRDLYIDDMTAPPNFDHQTILEIEQFKPAAIVIIDWPINGTEHSQFTHWASETYRYIQSHYRPDYEKGIIHVFVRN